MNKAVFSEVGPYSNQQLLPHVYLLVEGCKEKLSFYQFHQVSVPPNDLSCAILWQNYVKIACEMYKPPLS